MTLAKTRYAGLCGSYPHDTLRCPLMTAPHALPPHPLTRRPTTSPVPPRNGTPGEPGTSHTHLWRSSVTRVGVVSAVTPTSGGPPSSPWTVPPHPSSTVGYGTTVGVRITDGGESGGLNSYPPHLPPVLPLRPPVVRGFFPLTVSAHLYFWSE